MLAWLASSSTSRKLVEYGGAVSLAITVKEKAFAIWRCADSIFFREIVVHHKRVSCIASVRSAH